MALNGKDAVIALRGNTHALRGNAQTTNQEKTKLDNTQFLTHTLKHQLDEQLNMPTLKADSIKIEGTIGILGGFSLAKPARKPIYASLQPGSIIELTRSAPYTTQEYHELYTEGLGLFRNIGYGTVIPIPLENAK